MAAISTLAASLTEMSGYLSGCCRAKASQIRKGRYGVETHLPKPSYAEKLLIRNRVQQRELRRENGRSPRKLLPTYEKSREFCRPKVAAPAQPIAPPSGHFELMLPGRLQIPTRDCSWHFRFRAGSPAFP